MRDKLGDGCEPGWYECRQYDGARRVLWHKEGRIFESPEAIHYDIVEDGYTDFLGPLVPASRAEEVESLRERLCFAIGYLSAHCGCDECLDTMNMLRAALSPPLSTPDERSVKNG